MSYEELALGDFAPYEPSGGIPAAFIMAKVQESSGKLHGYVALQIPLEQVNDIMQERTGLGETGETYLVGPDNLMRSDSFLDPINHSVAASFADPTKGSVDTEATEKALAGNSGSEVIVDYNGNPVLSSFAPVTVLDTTWAIIAEIDVAEAFSPVDAEGDAFFEKYQQMYGYYDLFLINPDGYVFFSATKEADYQTNMLNGPYKDSGLGQLVSKVLDTQNFGFADFAPYEPSGGVPAAFIAQPLVHEGNAELVIALQLPLDRINSIMQERTGMGDTGETYLVGPNKLMRSDSYLDPQGHSVAASFAGTVGNNGVDTKASQEALTGNSGTEIIIDYNGNPVLSAYDPLMVYGTRWAIIAEQDQLEALAAARQMLMIALLLLGLALIIIPIIAILIANSIANPILLVAEGARRLALGDAVLEGMDWEKITKLNARKDELGITGKAFAALIDYFKDMTTAAQYIAKGDLTTMVKPRAEVDLLGNAFAMMINNLRDAIGRVAENAVNVNAASNQLAVASEQAGNATTQIAATVQQIAAGAQQQSSAANESAASVDDLSQAIDGVAKGAQEQATAVNRASTISSQLGNTIQQVANNAQAVTQGSATASDSARRGAQVVEETIGGMQVIRETVTRSSVHVKEMGARSEEVGAIVQTIEEIASQTNLLALNAAIEAARAGEHGKGFAVVAEEVRKLAERSAVATQEIGGLIKGIQSTVAEAVEGMGASAQQVEEGVIRANEAGKALNEILQASEAVFKQAEEAAAAAEEMSAASDELTTAIDAVSAVVEENTAATEEMAAGSSEVTAAIESIASISEENSASIEEVSASTEEMSAQVEEVNASAQSLAEMAKMLREIVAQFKLASQDGEVSGEEQRKQNFYDGIENSSLYLEKGNHHKEKTQISEN